MADASNVERSCSCGVRMSTNIFDKHTLCSACIGHACNLNKRCNECESWSEEHMLKYVQTLERVGLRSQVRSISVNKPATTADNNRPSGEQKDEVRQSEFSEYKEQMSQKLSDMMSGIAALIDSKLEQHSRNISLSHGPNTPHSRSADQGPLEERKLWPGSNAATPPGVSRESHPIRHDARGLEAKSVGVNKRDNIRSNYKGQSNPCQGKIGLLGKSKKIDRKIKVHKVDREPRDQATVRGKSQTMETIKDHNSQRNHNYVEENNDDDDDDDNNDEEEFEEGEVEEEDKDEDSSDEQERNNDNNNCSGKEDEKIQRLLKAITEFFPQAKSQLPQSPPRQLLHENRFNNKKIIPKKNLRLYDRVSRVRSDVAQRVSVLMRKGSKLNKLLPSGRRSIRVAEDESFEAPPELNEGYERLTGQMSLPEPSVVIPLGDVK